MCYDITVVGFGNVRSIIIDGDEESFQLKPLVVKSFQFDGQHLTFELEEFTEVELTGFDILINWAVDVRPTTLVLDIDTATFFVEPDNFTFTKLLDVVAGGTHEPGYPQIRFIDGAWYGVVTHSHGSPFKVGPFNNPVKAWLMYKHAMVQLQENE